jgi:hypothetical protein
MPPSSSLSDTFNAFVADLNNVYSNPPPYTPKQRNTISQYLDPQIVIITPHDGAVAGIANVLTDCANRAPEQFGPNFSYIVFNHSSNSGVVTGTVTGTGPYTDHDRDMNQPPDIQFTFHYIMSNDVWILKHVVSTRN